MKKLVCLILCVCMLFVFCSCGKVDNLIQKIDEFSKNEDISQVDIDALFEEYNNLSDKDKEKVTNYAELEKYKDVSIEKVKTLKGKISDVSDKTSFSVVREIDEEYNALNSNEKKLVYIASIKEKMKLTNLEKAAVAACQYIKKSLRSSSSFELQDAKVIDDLNGESKYYLVKIKFSATNGFGGANDDTSFQTISKDFENPWYALSFLSGDYSNALNCTPYQKYYLLNEQEPTSIDCEKILYYIDAEVG